MLQITAFYAGLLGLLSIALTLQAGRLRMTTGIQVGDGGNEELVIAMRRHANFVEYVPLVLILIGSLEMNGASPTAVHVLGAGFVVARICHAVGFGIQSNAFRTIGAIGSTGIVAVTSVWNLVVFF